MRERGKERERRREREGQEGGREETVGERGYIRREVDMNLFYFRAMEFIQVFLMEVANGEERLDIAAGQ